MKLHTIMISAYLTAMLLSNAPSVPRDAVLAGTIDMSALRSVATEYGVQGLIPASSVKVPEPQVIAVSLTEYSEMSQELMSRLIRRTLSVDKEAWIDAPICKVFGLCDGSRNIPAKQIVATKPEGQYFFGVSLNARTQDVVISFKNDSMIESYLVDKSGKLRAAAISDLTGLDARLITNEQALEKFTARMTLLAKMAEKLPPTDSIVSNS